MKSILFVLLFIQLIYKAYFINTELKFIKDIGKKSLKEIQKEQQTELKEMWNTINNMISIAIPNVDKSIFTIFYIMLTIDILFYTLSAFLTDFEDNNDKLHRTTQEFIMELKEVIKGE